MEKLLSKLQERTESQIEASSVRWGKDTAYFSAVLQITKSTGLTNCSPGIIVRASDNMDAYFVFRGRRGDLLKIIWWDSQGACLFSKRFERGRFVWPAAKDGKISLTAAQLATGRLPWLEGKSEYLRGTLLFQMGIEIIEAGEPGHWHHEVTAGIPDLRPTLYFALPRHGTQVSVYLSYNWEIIRAVCNNEDWIDVGSMKPVYQRFCARLRDRVATMI